MFRPLSCLYPCGLGQLRYMLVFMMTTGIVIAYLHRSVFNVSIVEMVTIKKLSKPSTCLGPSGQANSTIFNIGGGKVDWTEQQQQILIAGFFPLYFLLHLPSGLACDYWGARHFLLWSHIISSTLTAIMPIAAVTFPWYIIFVFRMLVGAVQAVQFPATSSLMSAWIPSTERATMGGIVFAANSFGLVFGNLGTGLMIKHFEDWRVPYYVWATVGYVYSFLFLGFVFSEPQTSPFITEVELEYLQSVIVAKHKERAPFLKIFLDKCIWGMIAAQMGNGFVLFLLLNNLPKYLNNVLGFEISMNGIISLIFILMWIGGVVVGAISDHLIKHRNCNISWSRKIVTGIANVGSSLGLIGVNLVECNHYVAVAFFAVSCFLKGIYCAGIIINIMDITLNHSAGIMAIINGAGAIPGFVGTYVISIIVPNNTHAEWRVYFLGVLVIEVITTILYFSLSTSDRRAWDYQPGEQPVPRKKAKHWWLQMTPSDDAIRKDKDKKAIENRKAAAKEAKAKAREKFQELKAARSSRIR